MNPVDLFDFEHEDTDFLDADKDFVVSAKQRMHDAPKAVGDDEQSIREWIFDSQVLTEYPNVASGLRVSLLRVNASRLQGRTLYGSVLKPIATPEELIKLQS